MSDSRNLDDVKLHLELVRAADDARRAAVAGESEAAKARRESVVLLPSLRARVDEVYGEVQAQAPGLTAAEAQKLAKSEEGRAALDLGKDALGRVDDHLQSRTGKRNPVEGKRYGVFGNNPTSFGGVARALHLSLLEDERVRALAEGHAEKELAFTAFIASEVRRAHESLQGVMGERIASRANLSRVVSAKDETLNAAESVLTAVRGHLYANLPGRKQDDELREYGFTPIEPSGRGKGGGGAGGSEGGVRKPVEPEPKPES